MINYIYITIRQSDNQPFIEGLNIGIASIFSPSLMLHYSIVWVTFKIFPLLFNKQNLSGEYPCLSWHYNLTEAMVYFLFIVYFIDDPILIGCI